MTPHPASPAFIRPLPPTGLHDIAIAPETTPAVGGVVKVPGDRASLPFLRFDPLPAVDA